KVDKERKKVVKKLKIEFKDDDDKLESIKGTMWPFRHHRDDLSEQARMATSKYSTCGRVKILHPPMGV
ncbi:MAG: hypothetical protein U9N58_09225, partial [Thermodesulfobacteriota bacterium]|nr:hypothetical protein [Thermodesulfobacteriota bacterium]